MSDTDLEQRCHNEEAKDAGLWVYGFGLRVCPRLRLLGFLD